MKTLHDMEMGEKRELGYDLEAVVAREIRGRSHQEIDEAIRMAVEEGGAQSQAVLDGLGVTLEEPGEPEDTPQEDEPSEAAPAKERVAIQVLCDPIGVDIFRRDIIIHPKDGIARRYPHTRLTLAEAHALIEEGRGRLNPRASKTPEKRTCD